MKKILSVLLLTLFAFICKSQVYTPINNYGQTHQRIKANQNFKVPYFSNKTRQTNDLSAGDFQMYINGDTSYVMYNNGARWKSLVDSFSSSNDSLFYYKFGVKTFLLKSGGGNPAGNDQEVQYNNNGVFGSNNGFLFDGSSVIVPRLKLYNSPFDVYNSLYNDDAGTHFEFGNNTYKFVLNPYQNSLTQNVNLWIPNNSNLTIPLVFNGQAANDLGEVDIWGGFSATAPITYDNTAGVYGLDTSNSCHTDNYYSTLFAPISVNGTVTNVATTNGLGITSSVANATTMPNITIEVDTANSNILSRQRAASLYTYTAGRGTTLASNTFRFDTSLAYTYTPVVSGANSFLAYYNGRNSPTANSQILYGLNVYDTVVPSVTTSQQRTFQAMDKSGQLIFTNQPTLATYSSNQVTEPSLHLNRYSSSGTHGFYLDYYGTRSAGINYTSGNSETKVGGLAVDLAAILSLYRNNTEHARFAATTGNLLIGTTTDGGFKFDVNGTARVQSTLTTTGRRIAYTAKTGNYTITSIDEVVNCTSGTFTVTLPTAVGITGQTFTIKNSGAGTITVATTSSQTIDGVTTKTLNVQYGLLKVASDGANYIILSSQ